MNKQSKTIVHPASIEMYVDATWKFARAILWNGQRFFKYEEELAMNYIREYYEAIPADNFPSIAAKHFTTYCERVLLARNYVSRFSHRYIPHPCIWLNRLNPKGFAGTKKWHDALQQRRKGKSFCPNCSQHRSSQSFNKQSNA